MTTPILTEADLVEIRKKQVGRYGTVDPSRPYADSIAYGQAVEAKVLAKLAAMNKPLFLLHTGQIGSDGEQDEWETEADSGQRVDDFCRKHPGQTIELFPYPPAAQDREDGLRVRDWSCVKEVRDMTLKQFERSSELRKKGNP